MSAVPILLVGDSPRRATGLGRIGRDVAALLWADQLAGTLEIELTHFGIEEGGGPLPPWPLWTFTEAEEWGVELALACARQTIGARRAVLFTIWDPMRCLTYLQQFTGPQWDRWGYFPIDGANVAGGLSGPAAAVVSGFERVLGYGRWGAEVLRRHRPASVPYLPHGLSDVFTPYGGGATAELLGPCYEPGKHLLIGCVAANQPRKDFPSYFAALTELRRRGWPVYGWLHTDTLVKAWAVQQLVMDYGLKYKVTVTTELHDRDLASLYRACSATIAPGLGEGFGYPIVESLASGVPVIHVDHAGGAELIPKTEWRVPVRAARVESVHNIVRPVLDPVDVANATERALRWRERVGKDVCMAYCAGAVAHLRWEVLWPRWRAWVREGLEAR